MKKLGRGFNSHAAGLMSGPICMLPGLSPPLASPGQSRREWRWPCRNEGLLKASASREFAGLKKNPVAVLDFASLYPSLYM